MDNKILDKIKKLMDLQSSTSSEAEAQNCAARIQEMLIRYNLEMAEVEKHTVKGKSDVTREELDFNTLTNKRESDWVGSLLFSIAITNLCHFVKVNNGTEMGKGHVIGKPENIAVVVMLFDYLRPTIRRLAKEAWANYHGSEKRNTFHRGFYRGCVNALYARLRAQEEELKQNESSITALVVTNKAVIKNFLDNEYGNLQRGKPKSKVSGADGTMMGRAAGNNIPLNKQVGTNSNNLRG